MLVLVFRKKNSGVDVDLVSEGNGVSLRQATVGRPHTLRSSVYVGIVFKKISQCKNSSLLINKKYTDSCKTIRRIKRRKLD